jgi:hypothetical protein
MRRRTLLALFPMSLLVGAMPHIAAPGRLASPAELAEWGWEALQHNNLRQLVDCIDPGQIALFGAAVQNLLRQAPLDTRRELLSLFGLCDEPDFANCSAADLLHACLLRWREPLQEFAGYRYRTVGTVSEGSRTVHVAYELVNVDGDAMFPQLVTLPRSSAGWSLALSGAPVPLIPGRAIPTSLPHTRTRVLGKLPRSERKVLVIYRAWVRFPHATSNRVQRWMVRPSDPAWSYVKQGDDRALTAEIDRQVREGVRRGITLLSGDPPPPT